MPDAAYFDTCKKMIWKHQICTLLFLVSSCLLTSAVDRGNFKTCEQSGFCRRNRNLVPGPSPYVLHTNTLKVSPTKLEGVLFNTKNGVEFNLQVTSLEGSTLRLKISEKNPIRERFEPTEALAKTPTEANLDVTSSTDSELSFNFGANKAKIQVNPFRLDIFSTDGQLIITTNGRGLLNFEHYRLKDQPKPEGEANEVEEQNKPEPEVQDAWWEETYKSQRDSKPYGPSSVGVDISFTGFEHVYGLPEHADSFSLKQTKDVSDPYRLYNLDVGEYELNNPMALYGSIPYMMAHSETHTVGLLWLNAAESWIDLEAPIKKDVVSSIVDFVSGSSRIPQRDTHWFSESGIIDIFFLLGPSPKDVMAQYAKLTGVTPLPPLFSLAYHTCRWNYKDQEDVRQVDAGFDAHDIPYDVIWLDVDHTDNRKYFTWDPYLFPTPGEMIANLTGKGRKMVTLVDPHIKRDSSYHIHTDATSLGYYVKNKDGNDYEGWCWPGSSSYLDFLSPTIRDWWATRFLLENYPHSTLSLYTWNDMNEPSVFSEPEVTMPKDCRHHGGLEHREVHNLYGMLMIMGTYKGHLLRAKETQRPFILSRAFFIGSQRYSAVWTGDNTADWSHLRITIPMLLTMSISGQSFCGADVGGFFNNPSAELVTRWYQAGAFQPFFRSHSHHDTKRREPWLFDETSKQAIRQAVKKRYQFLPYWYTLFYENEVTGVPPMRPLWMEYPTDSITFGMEDQYLVGTDLLVKPVVDIGVSSIDIYLPGPQQVWYDIDTYHKLDGGHIVSLPVDIYKIPVFQRGGSIIPKKERVRRSSSLAASDPFTLFVALDRQGKFATGKLYLDRYDGFEYRKGDHVLLNFTYSDSTLKSQVIEGPRNFETKEWLERIVILGLPTEPKSIELVSQEGKRPLQSAFSPVILVIRKPGINIAQPWEIKLEF